MEDQPLAGKERQLDHPLLVAEYHARMDAFLRDETRSAMALVLPQYDLLESPTLCNWIIHCPRDQCHSVTVLIQNARSARQVCQVVRQEFERQNRVLVRTDMFKCVLEFDAAPNVRVCTATNGRFPYGIRMGLVICMEGALDTLTDDAISECPYKTVFCARRRDAIERCERLGVQPCYVDRGG